MRWNQAWGYILRKYLFHKQYVPGPVQDIKNLSVHKSNNSSVFREYWENNNNKNNHIINKVIKKKIKQDGGMIKL